MSFIIAPQDEININLTKYMWSIWGRLQSTDEKDQRSK